MLPYCVLFMIVLATILIQENDIKYSRNHFCGRSISKIPVFIIVAFVLFYGLRDHIGYDYKMYETLVKMGAGNAYIDGHGEWLSAAFLNLASYYGDPHLFFFLIALISFLLLVYSIINYVDVPCSLGWGMLTFLAIPLGLVYTLSIQRQFVAMIIILFSMKYVFQRKFYKFLFSIILAAGFHFSSIVFLSLYLVCSKKFRYEYFGVILAAGYIILLLFMNVVQTLFPAYAFYLRLLEGFDIGGELQTLLYLFSGIGFIFLRRYLRQYANYDVFLKAYLLGCVYMLFLSPISALLAFRVGGAGLMNIIFLVPYVFYAFKKEQRFYVKGIVVLAGAFLMWYGLYTTTGETYVPYKTFL